MIETPGTYIAHQRVKAGFDHADVALRVETIPHVCAARRAELLSDIEAGRVALDESAARALSAIPELRIDMAKLGGLSGCDASPVRFIPVPTLAEIVAVAPTMRRAEEPAR